MMQMLTRYFGLSVLMMSISAWITLGYSGLARGSKLFPMIELVDPAAWSGTLLGIGIVCGAIGLGITAISCDDTVWK